MAQDGSLPPLEVTAPLARFEGRAPEAPAWFEWAIAQAPERRFVTANGSKLELLTWGEVGKPGLFFIHGNSAHADWWSFIAPFFAADYRIAAMSLSGMGASDWRDRYAFSDFLEDAAACAQAAQLGERPVYVGHSFGGAHVLYAAAHRPELMGAAVLVDTAFGPRRDQQEAMDAKLREKGLDPVAAVAPPRVYPDVAAALARFRLMPPQAPGEIYVADFIARRALVETPREDGAGLGYAWRFDPGSWAKFDRDELYRMQEGGPLDVRVPTAHLLGERSTILARQAQGRPLPFPKGMIEAVIPGADHHVMVDQPLALVAALRTLLAAWAA